MFRHSLRTLALVPLALVALPGGAARAEPTQAVASSHQRVLPLEGGRNFRDLGGYRTSDGHSVRWGVLFRSGSMVGLTPHDYAYLGRLGIRVVCDFRDTRERKAEPTAWPAPGAPEMLSDDYSLDYAGLLPAGPMSTWTGAAARERLAASYPRMLQQFNSQYRRMFAELLAGKAPLAFHCSAGKDRTGIAAALLLTALGVPRETVIADYLLTNQTLDPASLLAGKATATSPWAQLPVDVRAALFGADRSYIEAALAVVDAHPGGADGYLNDELGVGPAERARLRKLYLD